MPHNLLRSEHVVVYNDLFALQIAQQLLSLSAAYHRRDDDQGERRVQKAENDYCHPKRRSCSLISGTFNFCSECFLEFW